MGEGTESGSLIPDPFAERLHYESARAFIDDPWSSKKARMIRMMLREVSYRRMKGLALYKAFPMQEAFHRSRAPERLAVGSNRSGKTSVAAAEVAMAAMGCHPYLPYPKENLRIICVAKDQSKIGEVMYRKLLGRGAYRIVFDKTLGLYRNWNPPVDGWDLHKTVPSLPLIPPEAIKDMAWEAKNLSCPKKVTLHNGTEIMFFTSAGRPIEGVDVDLVWFDEEIYQGMWYSEMSARLIDRNGRFIWSATPQLATDVLWELHEEAEKQKGAVMPRIEEFFFDLDANPFLSEQAKDDFKSKNSADPDQYRVRVKGQFLVSSHRVYPNFNLTDHGCEAFNIPQEWTRYLVIDPGFVNSVALFFAVPPKNASRHIYVYDELYCHQKDVKQFAEMLKEKTLGQNFQAFLIDAHGSRRTEVNGLTARQQYQSAFQAQQIRSIATGSDFITVGEQQEFGAATVKNGVSEVRLWLAKLDDGKPTLQIFTAMCPKLMDEMRKYNNKLDKNKKPTDAPDHTKNSHGPDCIRYAKIYGIPFVEPRPVAKVLSGIYKYARDKLRDKRKKDGRDYVALN